MTLTVWNRLETYGYRVLGSLCAMALVANVYKHGWHIGSMLTPMILTFLMFSLGVIPERRTNAWTIRYLTAFATCAFLFAGILYRLLFK
jgi:hypothetical protein